MDQKLFNMALYAAKPPKQLRARDVVGDGNDSQYVMRFVHRAGEECDLSMQVGLTTYVALAVSREEARQEGLEEARALWPPSEGWVGHTANMRQECLEDTLREYFDLGVGGWLPPVDDEDKTENAELLM